MSIVDTALQTQLANIQTRSGRTLDELHAIIRASGLTRHGDIRDMLKRDLALGHGDANTLTHFWLRSLEEAPAAGVAGIDQVLDGLYSGPKAALRPIHDAIMGGIITFGAFEMSPKKTYISLRRKRQFAMVGPATNTRVEVGLNIRGLEPHPRLREQPPAGMCQYKVHVTGTAEVDGQLLGWIRAAFDAAG